MHGVLFPPLLHDRQIISSSLAITSVHVRRGDVGGDNFKFADDHIYINVARTVQAMLPNGHVQIFSTTFDHFSKTNTYNDSQFDIYKTHGFHVHLDNPEIDDLTHFAQADVLICSLSAFSFVPSILNAICSLLHVVQHAVSP